MPAVLLLVAGVAVAACSGSTASSAASGAPSAAATSAASESAAASASAQASAAQASGGSGASVGPVPSYDVKALLGALANLDSYQETITENGKVTYQSTVVNKPTAAKAITMGDTKIVIVGDQAWLASGGKFQSVPSSMVTPMFAAFDPAALLLAFGTQAWAPASTDLGTEQKNGVSAHHYRIDTGSLSAYASIPPGATIDLWRADDGYLVALETKGFTGDEDLQIELTNINDASNKVEQPS